MSPAEPPAGSRPGRSTHQLQRRAACPCSLAALAMVAKKTDFRRVSLERRMKRFKSPEYAQWFLEVQGIVAEYFRPKRHLFKAAQYRVERHRRFHVWHKVEQPLQPERIRTSQHPA